MSHWTREQLLKQLRDPYNTTDLSGWEDQIRWLETLCKETADWIERNTPTGDHDV